VTRKERMFAAIRRQPIDCVPHATYNCHPYANSHHVDDPSYREILDQVGATAGAMIKVAIRSDWIGADRIEEQSEEQGDLTVYTRTLHTPQGDINSIVHKPKDQPGYIVKHMVESDADLEQYLSLPYEPINLDDSMVRAAHETAGDRAVTCITYAEPMHATARLFDFQDFCMRCITDLATIKRMVDWHMERCLAELKRQVEMVKDLDVIFHTSGPEFCTPPMLSPRMFAELVTPYQKKMIEVIHDAGHLAAIHCHGRVRDVLPEMLKTGVDFIEPIEPPDQGDITLAELMTACEGRMALMGHVQDQEFYSSKPGDMTRWVEEVARVVDGRTGYIMSPTCTPFQHPCTDTYKANYLEWLQAAARVFGT
jgi:uroporphyrinogen-III decarboxylase